MGRIRRCRQRHPQNMAASFSRCRTSLVPRKSQQRQRCCSPPRRAPVSCTFYSRSGLEIQRGFLFTIYQRIDVGCCGVDSTSIRSTASVSVMLNGIEEATDHHYYHYQFLLKVSSSSSRQLELRS